MALDPVTNFGEAVVSGGHGSTSISIQLNPGEGVKLPSEGYNVTWWDTTLFPRAIDDPQKEIVRVTGNNNDILTVIRGQEGISASNKNTIGSTYKIARAFNKKDYDDINSHLDNSSNPHNVSLSQLGGTTDHGGLSGLGDDDHAQYFLTDGTKSLSGLFQLSGNISPPQITGIAHNYNPTGLPDAGTLRVSSSSIQSVTGIVAGSPGRLLFVCNVGTFDLLLLGSNTGSSANNRFLLNADITVKPNDMVLLQYDITALKWKVLSGGGGGGGSVTIQEQDGIPTGTLSTLKTPNGSLIDNGGGSFSLDIGTDIDGGSFSDTYVNTADIDGGVF